MKKTDTIAFYQEAYLKGKSEEDRNRFFEKDIDKQYGAIMAWKRRSRIAGEEKQEVTAASIINALRKAKTDLPTLKTLSDSDREKIYDALNGTLDELVNFDRNKTILRINSLIAERDKIYRQGEDLNRQIDELNRQLG